VAEHRSKAHWWDTVTRYVGWHTACSDYRTRLPGSSTLEELPAIIPPPLERISFAHAQPASHR